MSQPGEVGEDEVVSEEVAMLVAMMGNEHKAYWDSRYVKELDEVRFAAKIQAPADGDALPQVVEEGGEGGGSAPEGEGGGADPMDKLFVWFGKMPMLLAAQAILQLGIEPGAAEVVDVGCGNGYMCEVLHALGVRRVWGTDYSPAAIRLAQTVSSHFRRQKGAGDPEEWGTRYVVDDVLNTRLERGAFDLVYDSGLLDSVAMTLPEGHGRERGPFDPPLQPPPPPEVSTGGDDGLLLGPSEPLHQGYGEEGYFRNVCALLKPGGFLLLRSCNHRLDEMKSAISGARVHLEFLKDVSIEGTGILAVVFRKPVSQSAPSA